MTDPLIDKLVADLSPRNPLVNLKLWMHCTACMVLIAAMILGFMGLRGDYAYAIQTGAMFWKPGLFFLAWLGSVMLITDISRPSGKIKEAHLIPLALGAGILIWQFTTQTTQYSFQTMFGSLQDGSVPYCLSVIMGGGGLALMMAWKFWFSKTASPHPTLLGFLAGISAGTLAATAYALHCDRDFALYVFVYYGLSILILSIVGSLLGKKLLRW
jgi:hypothetical protein